MMDKSPALNMHTIIRKIMASTSEVYAQVSGSAAYPDIRGRIDFYPLWDGTIVTAFVSNLPLTDESSCHPAFHGFHIHEGTSCQGTIPAGAAFPLSGNHYNPNHCPHPEHAGDLPPLLASHGIAMEIFYTDRFVPEEIVGRTVIIHSMTDDFTTQPSGHSGDKIACGEIKRTFAAPSAVALAT